MSFIPFTNREEDSGSVVKLRLEIEGSLVQDSPEALSCVLELDTLLLYCESLYLSFCLLIGGRTLAQW